MKNMKMAILSSIVPLSLTGCAGVPPKSELHQLNGNELQTALIGNTYTTKEKWGRWAEFLDSPGHVYARASGSGWQEGGTGTYRIDANGEWCETFTGDADWAKPEYEYCGLVYRDADGNYYGEVTKNTRKPERVGNMRKAEIKTGDEYALKE